MLVPLVLSLIFRLIVIGEYGLHGDEANKVTAVRLYLELDFTDNVPHPAGMKLVMAFFLLFLDGSEFVYRLPSTLASSATIYPIFYIGKRLYSEFIGYMASLLWAANISVLAFATVAKEDGFLTFFWTLAIYYFVRWREDPKYLKHIGIAVGLAMASKYTGALLILLLIPLLFFAFGTARERPKLSSTVRGMTPYTFATFFIVNFVLLIPATIRNIIEWTKIRTDSVNESSLQTQVVSKPWFRYILHIMIKHPIPFLLILIVGIVFAIRRRGPNEKLLLLWIFFPLVFYSMIPWGFPRYYHIMHPAFMIVGVKGIVELTNSFYLSIPRFKSSYTLKRSRIVSLSIISLILFNSIFIAMSAKPFYRMYTNEFDPNAELDQKFFLRDNIYDYYLWEAIYYVNENAADGSAIAMDAINVGAFYGRIDLQMVDFQDLPTDLSLWTANITYAIVQNSRTEAGNAVIHAYLQTYLLPVQTYSIDGIIACEVYQISR